MAEAPRSAYVRMSKGARLNKLLRTSKRKYQPSNKLTAAVKPTKKFVAMVDKVLDKRADLRHGEVLEPVGTDYNACHLINNDATHLVGWRAFGLYPLGNQPVIVADGVNQIHGRQCRVQKGSLTLRFAAFYSSPHSANVSQRDLKPNRPFLLRWAIVKNKPRAVNNELDENPGEMARQLFHYPRVGDPGDDGALLIYREDYFKTWTPQKYRDAWQSNTNSPPRLTVIKSGSMLLHARPAASTSGEVFIAAASQMMQASNWNQPTDSNDGDSVITGLAAGAAVTRTTGVSDVYYDDPIINIDTTEMFDRDGLIEWGTSAEDDPNDGSDTGPINMNIPTFVCYVEPQSWTTPTAPTWGDNTRLRFVVRGGEKYTWTD